MKVWRAGEWDGSQVFEIRLVYRFTRNRIESAEFMVNFSSRLVLTSSVGIEWNYSRINVTLIVNVKKKKTRDDRDFLAQGQK